MGKVITIMNQKGGVGKTTTVINLGCGLKNHGKKVMLIDMDPQANLTASVGIRYRELNYSIIDVFLNNTSIENVVQDYDGIHVVPSSMSLSGFDIQLANLPGRESLLKKVIESVKNQYDCILIDCPPTMGLLTLNSLTAADGVIIPIQAGYLPLEGVSNMLEVVNVIKGRLNQDLKIDGVVVTMYDRRQKLQKEVVELLREHFKELLFQTKIRNNVALAEAPSFGEDIFRYSSKSTGAKDYENLCKEVLERGVV